MSVTLFDGDDALFKRCAAACSTYAEYGMGASTLWILEHSHATVHAVDTSRDWVERTIAKAADKSRLFATWVDLGPLGDWGWPVTFEKRHKFNDYVEAVWMRGAHPDLVLVDGRFRVCCFLHSLLSAAPGTQILFDDYSNRPWYHVVEEFIRPVETCGRQCRFVVPASFDRNGAREVRERFLYVRD